MSNTQTAMQCKACGAHGYGYKYQGYDMLKCNRCGSVTKVNTNVVDESYMGRGGGVVEG